RRMGNRHPSIAPYETLRCADGAIAVACGNDRQFARLCEVLEIAPDARFATNPSRVAHRDDLVTALEKALHAKPAAEWEKLLTTAGVPAGLVGDIGEAITRAAALGLDPLVAVGDSRQVRHPVRYARATTAPTTRPPRLGEHTDTIRAWLRETR